MNKKEKVIKGLECCAVNHVDCYKLDDCSYKNAENDNIAVCVDILMTDALKLLKVQEPVKPNFCGYYQCGVCGADIGHSYEANYCPKCGKAVKWNG